MFKLKNGEASALFSPVMNRLLADGSKTFPFDDAFKILDILNVVEKRLKPYNEKFLEIIKAHGGKIDHETGAITYENAQCRMDASRLINDLNQMEMEYPGDLLDAPKNWPKLTLPEIKMLSPLIKK